MEEFLANNQLIAVIIIWTLPWKAVALWKAARRKEMWWFAALLLINTFGILEMFYIFIASRWKNKENKAEESREIKT